MQFSNITFDVFDELKEVLRTALAKGADKAILVEVDDATVEKIEPLHVAKVEFLLSAYSKMEYKSVFVRSLIVSIALLILC
uniref:Uncharacterized protein n=1 Tax=Parascaris equorum TaxID=6256 RepID=A0A914R105_PAREQ